ncbi:uncharacterized protein Tco025E_03337 [Trypanosoma conorhini]|uniref:DUF3456 domain-containing protein n=1 Tax=Trypanosoma conorhini TaxID=83891 RepID=A0A422PV47_9TRYP|nr:uncharacterized protein Tco025E_03337 [Trypanosoma conorhini]RNF21601.1 hypothetical protein Tco025E_03337 [Trypanosoma conorhini]
MPQTLRRVPGCALASLWLLLLLLSLLPSDVFGATLADGDGAEDAAEVTRREYRCRTCVALATVFREEVLRPAAGMQRAAAAAADRSDSDAVRAGARQRLVVNVHDAIDGLCRRVHELHRAEHKVRAVDASGREGAAEMREELRLHEDDVLGSRRAVRDAVDGLCAAVLEEVNEPLALEAFAALLPKSKKPDEASATERDAAHQLGEAGAFCERQQMCGPATLQNIANEDATRRRLAQQLSKTQQPLLPRQWREVAKAALLVAILVLLPLSAGLLLRRCWGRHTAAAAAHGAHKKSD